MKKSVLRSYFSGVVALRAELFGLWERGERLLAAPEPMRAQINRAHWLSAMSGCIGQIPREMQQVRACVDELIQLLYSIL